MERPALTPTSAVAADEVERRRATFGANKLPERQRAPALHPPDRGSVSLAIGNVEDAAFIFAVLLFNAGLGTYQEHKAESAAAALQQVMRITAQVVRGSEQAKLHSEALVPGDPPSSPTRRERARAAFLSAGRAAR